MTDADTNVVGKKRMLDTRMLLERLCNAGDLEESLLKGRVLEFGAGRGTSTPALTYFGGNVEAVDISEHVHRITASDLLPADNVYQQDGIELMNEREETYDIVASFLFGPLYNATDDLFLKNFYAAACRAIKEEGKIILTSDLGSFRHIERLAKEGYGEARKDTGLPPVFIGGKERLTDGGTLTISGAPHVPGRYESGDSAAMTYGFPPIPDQ